MTTDWLWLTVTDCLKILARMLKWQHFVPVRQTNIVTPWAPVGAKTYLLLTFHPELLSENKTRGKEECTKYLFYLLDKVWLGWARPERTDSKSNGIFVKLYIWFWTTQFFYVFFCFLSSVVVCTFNLQRSNLNSVFHYQIISKLFTLKLELLTSKWGDCET